MDGSNDPQMVGLRHRCTPTTTIQHGEPSKMATSVPWIPAPFQVLLQKCHFLLRLSWSSKGDAEWKMEVALHIYSYSMFYIYYMYIYVYIYIYT